MATGDQEVALQVRAPVVGFDPGSQLATATNYETGQTQLQRLNRINQGEDIQFRSQLIRDAAAHALDADSWDAAMRAAAKKGAPEAIQYVGRYTPLLQQRLFDAYAGASPAAGGGTAAPGTAGGGAPGAEMLDRMYANVPPERMVQSLQKNNMIMQALLTVKDEASYNRAIANLQASGIPNVAQIAGPYSPMNVIKLFNEAQQRAAYLQNRVASAATGAPAPLVKNETKSVGGIEYSVDPYRGTATPMTPPLQKPVPDTFGPNGEPVFYTEQGGLVRPGAPMSVPDAAKRISAVGKNGIPALTPVPEDEYNYGVKMGEKIAAAGPPPEGGTTMGGKAGATLPEVYAQIKDDTAGLSKAGLPVTTASLALAKQFGVDGANKVLKALHEDPTTPMEKVVSKEALKANPALKGKSVEDYAKGLLGQVGDDPVATEFFHKGQYDKPQLVEVNTEKNKHLFPKGLIPDDEGSTYQVLAQQNNRTGQWVTADEKRTPIDSTGAKIIPESAAGGGSGRFAGQVMRILINAEDATSEIKNIAELPLSASTGFLAGYHPPPTLLGATKAVLARTLQKPETQEFNTSMIGMGKALATLETGGLQTNKGLMDQFEKLALNEGDTELTKMRKLATMRQQAENALKGTISSPLLGRAQKEQAKKLMDQLAEAVPWTPHDVTELQKSTDPKATLADFAKSKGLTQQQRPVPTASDIAYVKAHPEAHDKFVKHFGVEP